MSCDIEVIKQRTLTLASRIEAPTNTLPTFGFSKDFGYPHIHIDGQGYHYIVIERGEELERKTTHDIEELLYWIFKSVTFQMATSWEVSHRADKVDFRRLLFSQQLQLLSMLSADMVRRWSIEVASLLQRVPFEDP